jgi:hypothetical protein
MEPRSFSDEIREIVRSSEQSVYDLAREMAVAPSVVYRFLNGAGMSTASLDRLSRVLDLHVTVGPRRNEK